MKIQVKKKKKKERLKSTVVLVPGDVDVSTQYLRVHCLMQASWEPVTRVWSSIQARSLTWCNRWVSAEIKAWKNLVVKMSQHRGKRFIASQWATDCTPPTPALLQPAFENYLSSMKSDHHMISLWKFKLGCTVNNIVAALLYFYKSSCLNSCVVFNHTSRYHW